MADEKNVTKAPAATRTVMKEQNELLATAKGLSLAISTKVAIEMCTHLRGRKLARAKAILEAVLKKKEAIPFKRFTNGVGHRKGISSPGRYPIKGAALLLKLIKSAEANATNKGMTGELVIQGLRANRASQPMRGGRKGRQEAKRTHIYVTLAELPGTHKEKKEKKQAKKEEKQAKKEEKKAEPKKAEKPVKKEAENPAAKSES